MKEYILKIDGMRCTMCETHINDLVRRSEKVKKVSSSHKKGETRVVMDENLSIDNIIKSVEKDGYKVLKVEEKTWKKTSFFQKIFKKN